LLKIAMSSNSVFVWEWLRSNCVPNQNLKVLIAGGGIGGLTALLALRARGIDAQLFEQAEAFRQVGAGIQLSSNATRILRSLGLGDALARACVYPEGRDYRAWDDGDRLYYTPLGARAEAQFGAPYYHAHRADLLDVLLGGVANTRFRLNARIEGFAQTADHNITVILADGTKVTGDVLIGADGIHSTVRGQLFGTEQPCYTGNVAWRGLVPAERVAHLDLGRVTGVWMGPNRSIVQYYVAAGRTFNWIGSAGRSSRRAVLARRGRIEDALAEYSGWHTTIRSIIAATPRVLRQALYDREPLPDWRVGRVVLLGDAAHPMMPFYAQGAAQSIEDAYVLAGCLAANPAEPEATLRRYVQLRQPRTAWMQDLSRREEELYQMTDAAAIAARNARMRTNRTPESASFPPEQMRLYGYDAEAVLRGGAVTA
jgi:salicylate hydroxylase